MRPFQGSSWSLGAEPTKTNVRDSFMHQSSEKQEFFGSWSHTPTLFCITLRHLERVSVNENDVDSNWYRVLMRPKYIILNFESVWISWGSDWYCKATVFEINIGKQTHFCMEDTTHKISEILDFGHISHQF